jgi:TPR repeat protein
MAAALFAWRHRTPAAPGAVATSVAADVRKPEASSPPAHDDSASSQKSAPWKPDAPDDRPFAEIRPELERRALAGDAAAARRLGITLANCNHFVDMPDEKLQDIVVDGAARGFTMRDGDSVVPPEEILARMRLGMAQKRRDCRGVSGLDEPDAFKQAFKWTERAAALGDADAEATYGTLAFADIDDRDALVKAETLRERKQLAVDYAKRALAAGDALALARMSGYYLDSPFFPSNPETAYAYLFAYSLTTRAAEIVPELLQRILAEHAATLDAAARERAEAEGARLAACCDIASPEAP